MKKLLLLAVALMSMAAMFAQTSLTLTFNGRDQHNARVQLDNVTIQNVTRGWTETIYFPDTVYTLTVGTGVVDYLLHNGMQVMPNPFNGRTQVNLRSAKSEKATIIVADITGKRCAEYSGLLSDGDNYFEIQLTTPQTYILSVQTADGTRTLKMVNIGSAGNNQIKEAGVGANAIQLKSTTAHTFELGDEMCYTGYSQQSSGLVISTPITKNQYTSEEITLCFVLGEDVVLPVVATIAASNIGMNTATTGGNVLSDGGATVIARGVCYSVTHNPTLAESHTMDGTGTGVFTSNLTNLVENTTYYVRAYATNSAGTAYGDEMSFTTEAGSAIGQPCPGVPTVTDYDGNIYNTVQIGAQCWMKENVRTTHYANGDPIPEGYSYSTLLPCRYTPNNNVANVTAYGYLYNWPAVMHGENSSSTNPSGVQGICPTGWHVPSEAEWDQLANYVNSQSEFLCGGYNNLIAKALASNVGWNYHNESNPCVVCNNLSLNNATGFSAMPAGMSYGEELYYYFGDLALFASATYDDYEEGVSIRYFYYDESELNAENGQTTLGSSVRCVRGDGSTTQIPKVITNDVMDITDSTVTCSGYVINSGATAVTSRGFCYGTSPNPNIFGSHTTEGAGAGAFSSLLSNLEENTTYYVRAYATNSVGTGYGEEVTFSLTPTVNNGVIVTFNGTTWQAGSISGIWYSDYGAWDVYASQTEGVLPIADIATSITAGTSSATASSSDGSLGGDFNWVEYYNETYLQDGNGTYYGDYWAKNVTCTVSSFDATALTLTANVNATMFSAYDAFISGTGVDDATTAPMTVNINNVTLVNSGSGATVPTVTTDAVTNASDNMAAFMGTVTSDGGATVTQCGVCWSTSPNPSLSNSYSALGSGLGSYSGYFGPLNANTTYYVRAYATNSAGTGYGNVMTLTTGTSPNPDDGVTVTFNNNTWQAGSISGAWYSDNGAWEVYASQIENELPIVDVATSITAGTSSATANSSTGGLSGDFYWVEYYNETYLMDQDNNYYGDYWAKSVTCTVSSFDATTLTLTANVNATMFSAYDAFISGTGVDDATTAPMTVNINNVSLTGSGSGSTSTVPTVTTGSVSNVTSTTAKCSGNVTSDGGATMVERGICWGTDANPTVSGNYIAASYATTGSFTVNITGLTPGTTYYARAYAINSEGTAYGSTVTFTTLSTPVVSSQWINYSTTIHDYWGSERDMTSARVAVDSNGLTYYNDGSAGYGFFFGLSQTYDFTHYVWGDVAYEGDIDINSANSYNIDSVSILGHYNRGTSVPAGNVDTLIVAILTTLTDSDLVTLSVNSGQTPIVMYYGVPYDPSTHFSIGASIYKLPLTTADCAETTEEGYLYGAYYTLPIGLNNITGKVINVCYSFKRGYTVPVNDSILNHSYFYGWISSDPRTNYFPHNGSSWFTPSDDVFYNQNQGAIISKDALLQSNPDAWYCKYFYPAPIWNASVQYPEISLKISCNDCAYTY